MGGGGSEAGIVSLFAAFVSIGGEVRIVVAPVSLEVSGAPLALRIDFTP